MFQKQIIRIVDWFYLPFLHKLIPLQTFRYGFCGGTNVGLDAVLYFLIFHFLLHEENLDLAVVVISPEIAAFLITFPITFLTGFWLAKNVSFQNSVLRTRTQSFRYFLVVLLNIAIKYFGLKLFVDTFHIFPSISNALLTVVTILVSYIMQNYFTFKGNSLTPPTQ